MTTQKCAKCEKILPYSAFDFIESTGKYRRKCKECRAESAYVEPAPPKYGTKAEKIRKVLAEREKVLYNRIMELTENKQCSTKEFADTYHEWNEILIKL